MTSTPLTASLERRKDSKGFTLIELIIVIAIIGILIAVAIPVYGAVQATARQRAVEATGKKSVEAITVALTDDDPNATMASVQTQMNEASVKIMIVPSYNGASRSSFKVMVAWAPNGDFENAEYHHMAFGDIE